MFKWCLPTNIVNQHPHPGETTCSSNTVAAMGVCLKRVFERLDADGDGKISVGELRSLLVSAGEEVTEEEVEEAVGEMRFEDLVRMMMEAEEEEEEEEEGAVTRDLRKAFEMLDGGEGCGAITAEGLRRALRRLGEERTEEECRRMIRAYDVDGNGVIDFHEFCRMMAL